MKKDSEIIGELVEREIRQGLYAIKMFSIPIWQILRFPIRSAYLNKINGFKHSTKKKKIDLLSFAGNYFSSLFRFIGLCFKRKIKAPYLFYAFPRLQHIGEGRYMDKFTDSVIAETGILQDSLIIQRSLEGHHFTNRVHEERVLKNDFCDYTSILLGIITAPFIGIIFFKKFLVLFKSISAIYHLSKMGCLGIIVKVSIFMVNVCFAKLTLSIVRPKHVFVVNRLTFAHVIVACKSKNIPVYEFQHGVTAGNTILYSGAYCKEIDPDLFLVFSDTWKGSQFALPLEKIYNIGWAYGQYIREKAVYPTCNDNTVLIISEPHITGNIIDFMGELSERYADYTFHLRPHPQESLSPEQKNRISAMNNAILSDTSLESSIALQGYSFILGENSSVLYEALDYGKRVGRIDFGKFDCRRYKPDSDAAFFYLKSFDDFADFVKSEQISKTPQRVGFDPFDLNKWYDLIKKTDNKEL